MKKHIIFLTTFGLLSFAMFGQEAKTYSSSIPLSASEGETQRKITTNVEGYAARSCVIDGEIFSTSNHPYMKKLCSLKSGELIAPHKGRKLAKKANNIDKVCCKSGDRFTWTLTRGKAQDSSCLTGSKASDRFCYRHNAPIANAPEGIEYSPKKVTGNKRKFLRRLVKNYEKKNKNSCGVGNTYDDRERQILASGGNGNGDASGVRNLGNEAYRYLREQTRSTRDRAATDFQGPGAPVCCKTGNGAAVIVANTCACEFKSSLNSDSKRIPATIVQANKYQCPKLHKALSNPGEGVTVERDTNDISNSEEDVLKDKLKNFLKGHNDCQVVNRASLPPSKLCRESVKTNYYFMDIICGNKTQEAICHKPLADNKDTKPSEIEAADCHTEG